MNHAKIVLPGGAGLVGQNLVARLKARGYTNITVLDKHRANLAVLRQVQPSTPTLLNPAPGSSNSRTPTWS